MIHAYDNVYLEKAQSLLGRMLDFAVYELQYTLPEFYALFLKSDVSRRFAKGDYTILVGRSGVEAVYDVLNDVGIERKRVRPDYPVFRSPEYWTGWALAYYQWETGLRFDEINGCVPIETVLAMYEPYHEMDIRQFCDRMNELYREAKPDTNLKTRRKALGISQSELAEMSGVPLRTVQQYEQRQKSINKAQTETLALLSKALECDIEELLEKVE